VRGRLARFVRDSCAIDRFQRVANGHRRLTDLSVYKDFRETRLAAEVPDLHSQRGSRRFESAHLHSDKSRSQTLVISVLAV
jgi:hypothetical protein